MFQNTVEIGIREQWSWKVSWFFERTLLSRKESHNLAWSCAISNVFYCAKVLEWNAVGTWLFSIVHRLKPNEMHEKKTSKELWSFSSKGIFFTLDKVKDQQSTKYWLNFAKDRYYPRSLYLLTSGKKSVFGHVQLIKNTNFCFPLHLLANFLFFSFIFGHSLMPQEFKAFFPVSFFGVKDVI